MSSKGGSNTTVQKQQLPAWLDQAAQENLAQAKIADKSVICRITALK